MSTKDDHDWQAAMFNQNAAEYQELLMPISMLGIVPELTPYGWEVKWGEITGIGKTPAIAIEKFNMALHTESGVCSSEQS